MALSVNAFFIMKNIIFFITHKTLSVEHVVTSFTSLSNQAGNKIFDKIYIYNTHPEEISNDEIKNIFYEKKLNNKIKKLDIFVYNNLTPKNLGSDLNCIINYAINNYNKNDRILVLKSDILLSKNYFNTVLNLPEGDIFFTSPFVCAKQRVTDDELFEYINREKFIRSDNITFYTEGIEPGEQTDFNIRGHTITDKNIKFFSCKVVDDFSCHFLSINILDKIKIGYQNWGGVNFNGLRCYIKNSDNCFTLHKYHSIISDNRYSDREGPVEMWLTA